MDSFACNYDSTATAQDSCIYFSPDEGYALDFVLGTLEPELGCNGGYAVAESLPLTLTATDSGMTWVFSEEVAQTLIDNGFGIVVEDLTTQQVSLCGSEMNVVDASGLNYMLDYDSTGFINPVYNGYLAPTENFEFGCGFEFACNYNPCALYDFDLCEFLDVMVETTVDNGSGDGTATATVEGGSEPYSFAWFAGESEDSFADSISVDSLVAGDYSVLAVDSTGCIGTTDFVIDAIDGVTHPDAVWRVFPNPANDHVHVNLNTPGRGELTLTDLGGREVLSNTLTSSRTTLDLGTLPAGMYVLQFKQETKLYTRHLHVIR